jgi:hypothetical protein
LEASFSFKSLSFVVFNFSVCIFLTSRSFPLYSIDGFSLCFDEVTILSFEAFGFWEDFLPIPEEPGAISPPLVPPTAYVLDNGPDFDPGFYYYF